MKLADKANSVLSKKNKKANYLSDIQVSTTPKCSFSGNQADFYIGLSSSNKKENLRIMGAVSNEMVETAIIKLLGQGWDDITWPVVLDLKKKILYHSYEAHKKGTSAIFGWQEYFSKKAIQ